MKEYSSFTAIEFVQNEHFFKWVKYRGFYPELDRYWQTWLAQHPHKAAEVEEARRLAAAIIEEGESVRIARKEEEILARLRASMNHDTAARAKSRFWRGTYWVAASAVIVLAATLGLWALFHKNQMGPPAATGVAGSFVKEVNNGALPKTIVLADGSSIVLQPTSALQYPKVFSKASREVILTGEGFFEISKDPARPFLVYTDKVIAKVLGTSFTVRAYEGEAAILVQVRTGKVTVSDRSEEKQTGRQAPGVLLVPNQQAVYVREEATLTKSLVEAPALLNAAAGQSFEFRDAPLRDVFARLEQAYGVDIVYDEELMRECALNVSLEDMPLYDKLRVICKTVEAQYEILDSHIVVTGKGCGTE